MCSWDGLLLLRAVLWKAIVTAIFMLGSNHFLAPGTPFLTSPPCQLPILWPKTHFFPHYIQAYRNTYPPSLNFIRLNTMTIHHKLIHSHIIFKLFKCILPPRLDSAFLWEGIESHICNCHGQEVNVFNWSFVGCSTFLTGNCGSDYHHCVILNSLEGRHGCKE